MGTPLARVGHRPRLCRRTRRSSADHARFFRVHVPVAGCLPRSLRRRRPLLLEPTGGARSIEAGCAGSWCALSRARGALGGRSGKRRRTHLDPARGVGRSRRLFSGAGDRRPTFTAVAVLFLLLAWGRHTPLNALFCQVVPGLSLFRYPENISSRWSACSACWRRWVPKKRYRLAYLLRVCW